MSNTTTVDEKPDLRQAEIIDHNVAAGYVTYIVDRWDGDKDDPTVAIVRFIGVWKEEDLETEERGAFDPLFWPKDVSRYSYRNEPTDPPALHWHMLESVKEADKELVKFKNDHENMTGESSQFTYGSQKKRVDLYREFLDAIDLLAKYPDNEEAWARVERWRNYNARLYEK